MCENTFHNYYGRNLETPPLVSLFSNKIRATSFSAPPRARCHPHALPDLGRSPPVLHAGPLPTQCSHCADRSGHVTQAGQSGLRGHIRSGSRKSAF